MEVQLTLHIISETPKWRPRIPMCATCSSASLLRTTSSTKIRTFRVTPVRNFCVSCCSNNVLIKLTFHSEKKNLESQYFSISPRRVGLHAAEPINAITRSNSFRIRQRRSLTVVLLPMRRPPIKAKLNGIFFTSRSGFHDGNMSIYSPIPIINLPPLPNG